MSHSVGGARQEIADRTKLVRFNPKGLKLPFQSLCYIGDAWEWLTDAEMRERHVEPFFFDSQDAAFKAAPAHAAPVEWDKGLKNPWPIVASNPVAEAERERRRREQAAGLAAVAEAEREPVRPVVMGPAAKSVAARSRVAKLGARTRKENKARADHVERLEKEGLF